MVTRETKEIGKTMMGWNGKRRKSSVSKTGEGVEMKHCRLTTCLESDVVDVGQVHIYCKAVAYAYEVFRCVGDTVRIPHRRLGVMPRCLSCWGVM